MQKITLIQSSLREWSNTAKMCREFLKICKEKWIKVYFVDLRYIKMDFCDSRPIEWYSQDIQKVYKIMQHSDVVIFDTPIYNFSMSGVLKNFIDVAWEAVKWKHIGTIINWAGKRGFLTGRDLLSCLYYQYETTPIYPTPYSWYIDFEDGERGLGELVSEQVFSKLNELAENILALKP